MLHCITSMHAISCPQLTYVLYVVAIHTECDIYIEDNAILNYLLTFLISILSDLQSWIACTKWVLRLLACGLWHRDLCALLRSWVLHAIKWPRTDRQTDRHTHNFLKCSHASVGLAQSRPNNSLFLITRPPPLETSASQTSYLIIHVYWTPSQTILQV